MPRFYVRNEAAPEDKQWNIYSTVIDNFLYDEWLSFPELVGEVVDELVQDKVKDLMSLLTDNPRVNTMSYAEACQEIEYMQIMNEDEDEDDAED